MSDSFMHRYILYFRILGSTAMNKYWFILVVVFALFSCAKESVSPDESEDSGYSDEVLFYASIADTTDMDSIILDDDYPDCLDDILPDDFEGIDIDDIEIDYYSDSLIVYEIELMDGVEIEIDQDCNLLSIELEGEVDDEEEDDEEDDDEEEDDDDEAEDEEDDEEEDDDEEDDEEEDDDEDDDDEDDDDE